MPAHTSKAYIHIHKFLEQDLQKANLYFNMVHSPRIQQTFYTLLVPCHTHIVCTYRGLTICIVCFMDLLYVLLKFVCMFVCVCACMCMCVLVCACVFTE